MTGRTARAWFAVACSLVVACLGRESADGNDAAVEGGDAIACEQQEPALIVGGDTPDTLYHLQRVVGAVRHPDGSLTIADAGAAQLRFHDRDGRHVRTVGRRGGGPSEFTQLSALVRHPGGGVAVYDRAARRVHTMGPDGQEGTATTIRTPGLRQLELVGVLASGAFVLAVQPPAPEPTSGSPERRDTVLFVTTNPEGGVRDTLIQVPHEVLDVRLRDAGEARIVVPSVIHFSPRAVGAAGPDVLYAGASDQYEIAVVTESGTVSRTIRGAWDPEPVTESDVNLHIRSLEPRYARRPPASREREMALLRGTASARQFPAFERLVVAEDGRLWVQRFRRPGDDATRWDVFEPSGQFLCRLTLQGGARLVDAGDDFFVAVEADEWDVERVVVYGAEIGKPPTE